jgi:hypothetical protein
VNRDENCPLFSVLLTKSVTFLHLGQLQLRIKFAMSAYIAHLWQWLNRKKTAVAVFFITSFKSVLPKFPPRFVGRSGLFYIVG